jgi:tetratricopeptide (TPR) repeat protein
MLRLLGLHRGPDISLPAAGALADADEGGTQLLLDELCGVHLLEEFRPGRYRLHDLLRVYASERAHADETSESQTAARKRMLAWYLYTTEPASQLLLPQRPPMRLDPPPPGCRPLHLADYEDALAWCTAERINLAAAVDDAALCGENGTGWRLAVTLSGFYMLTKHWTDWLATNRTGLICARRAGERDGEAQVLSSLGAALGDTGRIDEAVVYLEQALAIRQELGDRISAARILLNLGVACWELELVEKGLQRLHQALSIFEETGDAYGEGMTLNNLGDAYLGLERFEESQHYLRRALTVFRAGGNQFGESMTLTNLGTAHRRTGQLEQAERYLRQALVVRQQTANRHGEAITLRELGNALADAGRMAEAQESRAAALAIFEELGSQEADQMRQPLPATMTSTRAG